VAYKLLAQCSRSYVGLRPYSTYASAPRRLQRSTGRQSPPIHGTHASDDSRGAAIASVFTQKSRYPNVISGNSANSTELVATHQDMPSISLDHNVAYRPKPTRYCSSVYTLTVYY